MNRRTLVAAERCSRINRAAWAVAALGVLVPGSPLAGQTPTPLTRVQASGLDSTRVGRVTVHFDSQDRAHAMELANMAERAAAYFEREFDASFPLHLAVLRPKEWFVPYQGGDTEPYGMPWGWVPESLMSVPASLTEGVLIMGPDHEADRRRVRFVMLHEFGHLAAKRFLHPDGDQLYSSVRWFEELVATYFAYAFVYQEDPAWAQAGLREWVEIVKADPPPSASLDWRFMVQLPPEQFAATYGWYQNLLNVRAAELYARHGLSFLLALRDLPWAKSDDWTTESLLPLLEAISPGFERWAEDLQQGKYTAR